VHITSITPFTATVSTPTVFNIRSGTSLFPIDAALNISVTNRQAYSSEIRRYSVEIESTSSGWVKMLRVPIEKMSSGDGLYVGSSKELKIYHLVEPLNDLAELLKQPLGAGQTVKGWSFFEYPEGTQVPAKPRFRVTVVDRAGKSGVETSLSAETLTGDEIDNGDTFRVLQKDIDLTGCKFSRYTPLIR
jgi:hypothetical protein